MLEWQHAICCYVFDRVFGHEVTLGGSGVLDDDVTATRLDLRQAARAILIGAREQDADHGAAERVRG